MIQHFRELMALFPMIESAPQRIGDDEPSLKIVQMIEDAAFLDKARYSEVAKRQTVPKIYYKVCFLMENNVLIHFSRFAVVWFRG